MQRERRRTGSVAREAVLAGGLVALLAVTVVWGALGRNGPKSEAGQPAIAAGSAPDAEAVVRGRQAYLSTCIACHGEHGEARPNLGKDLAHSAFVGAQSDDQLLAFLKKGRNPGEPLNTTGVAMPPKGGNPALGDPQLRDIIAFLRSLQAASH